LIWRHVVELFDVTFADLTYCEVCELVDRCSPTLETFPEIRSAFFDLGWQRTPYPWLTGKRGVTLPHIRDLPMSVFHALLLTVPLTRTH
jgi:hypothetical protein